MTHRSCTTLAVIVAALAAAGPARAATPAWSTQQDLGTVDGYATSNSAIASNDRGDAVVVIANATGILVARARAHGDFSAPRRIATPQVATSGSLPRVAIDARGVALVAYSYNDGTHVATDFRDDDCCTGVKVSVWQPGHRPTTPRAVRPRGVEAQVGAIFATRGHRGVLVEGTEFGPDRTRLAPVRIDGRVGTLRAVSPLGWFPMSLQWAGGRAVAGLARITNRRGTELAVARQRRDGRFNAPRRFVHLSGQLSLSDFDPGLNEIMMTPDGHGGQIAVYQRGKRPNLGVALSRKPLDGRSSSAGPRGLSSWRLQPARGTAGSRSPGRAAAARRRTPRPRTSRRAARPGVSRRRSWVRR